MHEGGEPCPRCGLRSDHWTNNGQGVELNQDRYCCSGCARGGRCTCREQMQGSSGK
jgi:hypothetical protein